MLEARDGSAQRANLLEAGAHLFLAEELRAAASLLSDDTADPRATAERLLELSDALQVEACKQRSEHHRDDPDMPDSVAAAAVSGSSGAASAGVVLASRAASSMHRATQLRHAATAVLEFAQALRHGSPRGWTTTFGAGGLAACHPSIIPTLLALADNESALARACARPARPADAEHALAHAAHIDAAVGALDEPAPASAAAAAAASASAHGSPVASRPVVRAASAHLRRRLALANAELSRSAKLPSEAPPLLLPPAPDAALVAARVLARGGSESDARWKRRSRRSGSGSGGGGGGGGSGGVGVLDDPRGPAMSARHGRGRMLASGWRWRQHDSYYAESSSDDSEREEERVAEERFHRARRALKAAERLCKQHHFEGGVCVRCLEREVEQHETPERGHTPWRCPDGVAESQRW